MNTKEMKIKINKVEYDYELNIYSNNELVTTIFFDDYMHQAGTNKVDLFEEDCYLGFIIATNEVLKELKKVKNA